MKDINTCASCDSAIDFVSRSVYCRDCLQAWCTVPPTLQDYPILRKNLVETVMRYLEAKYEFSTSLGPDVYLLKRDKTYVYFSLFNFYYFTVELYDIEYNHSYISIRPLFKTLKVFV